MDMNEKILYCYLKHFQNDLRQASQEISESLPEEFKTPPKEFWGVIVSNPPEILQPLLHIIRQLDDDLYYFFGEGDE
jgi:hypothetical protein